MEDFKIFDTGDGGNNGRNKILETTLETGKKLNPGQGFLVKRFMRSWRLREQFKKNKIMGIRIGYRLENNVLAKDEKSSTHFLIFKPHPGARWANRKSTT